MNSDNQTADRKKICFIAQFPPPIHGLSKAVDTLYHSRLNSAENPDGRFEFEQVNLTENKKFLSNLRKIRKSRADLYYITISQTPGGNLRDLIIMRLLKRQHKKYLVHLHGGYYRRLVDQDLKLPQRNSNYKAMSHAAGAIVLGKSLKPIFEGMLPDSRIFTVPNCVDDQYLMSDTDFSRKVNGISGRPVRHVLYLSNFIRSKGYDRVLEMALLEKQRVNRGGERRFSFDFAGAFFDEEEHSYFSHYIEKNHLEDYVAYHGIVSGDEKRKLLSDCDVFVLLTRYPKEGQPISILEALGSGMLVITTDHAGIPDIVKNGVNGYCLKAGADTAANAYRLMMNADFRAFALAGRRTVLEHFTQSSYISGMEKVFESLA